jgi:hypothetical protein
MLAVPCAGSAASAKEVPAAETLAPPVKLTKDASTMEPSATVSKNDAKAILQSDQKIEKGQVLEVKSKVERATPDPVCIGFFDFVNNLTPIALIVALVCGGIVIVKKMDGSALPEVVTVVDSNGEPKLTEEPKTAEKSEAAIAEEPQSQDSPKEENSTEESSST